MLRSHESVRFIAISAVVVCLVIGVIHSASNVGFKIDLAFTAYEWRWIAPPYRSPYATADDLLQALAPTNGGVITRKVATQPPSNQFWTGLSGNGFPPNFLLQPGEGYEVRTQANEHVTIVGSHDDDQLIPAGQTGLPGNPPGGSIPPGFVAYTDYLMGLPYHSTADYADDVLFEIPGATSITRLVWNLGQPAFEYWTGSAGNAVPPNFPLEIGRAYLVRTSTNHPGFLPSHY